MATWDYGRMPMVEKQHTKKNHYPGSAAFEFPATKASCLQVQDPGCLSQGLWEAHPHASVSHLPLAPAVAGATPAVQSKC